MNSLYGVECGLPARLDAPNNSISFDADTIAAALVNIYQKKYGNGREIEPTLFEKTKEIFNNAVSKGWNAGGSPAVKRNSAFVDALKHNTDVFSAFRVHKMQSDIAAQLLDEKGNLKPFGKFVKDVKPYISHQNRAWLETEYNTAVLRAHQAADWKQFEAEKDVLPNLEWQPSTSPNPGEDHKPYWFTVLPVDHKFWTQHRPGDRWNCKCRLRNTDKTPTAVPVETVCTPSLQPSKGLESNPGTTGEIFSNSHPYYPENCGKCPFNKGVGRLIDLATGRKSNCNNGCRKIDKAINQFFIEERRKEYEQYKNDPDYLDVEFNEKTGGLKATHKDRKKHKHEKTPLGLTPTELEDACQDNVFKMGGSCIIQNEKTKRPNGEFATSLDAEINGKLMDIRSVCTPTTKIVNSLTDKHKQLISYYKDTNKKANALCLYYHVPTWYKKELIEKAIISYKKICKARGEKPVIKELVIILNGHNSPIEIMI